MNVYLDYAATTPLDSEILEKMLPLLRENFGNPDSLHSHGRRAAHAVTEARDRVANTLGVQPSEVYFTSGGTEANNWAISGMGGGKVLCSPIEHASVLESSAKSERGARLTRVGQNGIVTAGMVEEALGSDTGLVCLMAVNNETGSIQPVEEVAALCKQRGVLLFSDCVQAACSLSLKEICACADGISLSGHKVNGPKGVGALVVKKGVALRALIKGGQQERGLRGGTLNAAGIVGFAYALERAQRERAAFAERTRRLRDLFEDKLRYALGESVVIDGENRAPNVSHLTFIHGGATLVARLDLLGVSCSGGAACSAHSALPSHVMLSMGRSEEAAKRGVRFSFGRETTEVEVLFAADAVLSCVKEG